MLHLAPSVDDRNLIEEEGGHALAGRVVLTSFFTGLTPACADECIRILLDPQLRLTPEEISRAVPTSHLITKKNAYLNDAPLTHLTTTHSVAPQPLRAETFYKQIHMF